MTSVISFCQIQTQVLWPLAASAASRGPVPQASRKVPARVSQSLQKVVSQASKRDLLSHGSMFEFINRQD